MTAVVLQRPSHVAVVDDEPASDEQVSAAVYVGLLPDGPLYRLDGPAAVIWQEACGQDEAGLVARVARRTALDPDVVAGDVRRCVAELVSLGLLVPTEAT